MGLTAQPQAVQIPDHPAGDLRDLRLSRAVLLLSGGIDSTTLLYDLVQDGVEVHALTMDYGQTLSKEINTSAQNAHRVGARWLLVPSPLTWLPTTCSILRGGRRTPIPLDRTPEEIADGTPPTYVPFRNGVFLALAVAYGESLGIDLVYCGGNGLNSGLYWDDTLDFARAFQEAAREGTAPDYQPRIVYPYANKTKREIVQLGDQLGINYQDWTWSCYQNGVQHCGRCDSCQQRIKALT